MRVNAISNSMCDFVVAVFLVIFMFSLHTLHMCRLSMSDCLHCLQEKDPYNMGCQQSKLKKKSGSEHTATQVQAQPQLQVRATPAALPAAKPLETPSVTCPQQPAPAAVRREHSPAVVPPVEIPSFVPCVLCPSLQARRSRSISSAASSLGECVDYTQGNSVEAMVRYWRRKLDREKAQREASVEAFVAVAVFEALVRQQDACISATDDDEDSQSESHLGDGLADLFSLEQEAVLQDEVEEEEQQETESSLRCVRADSLEATPTQRGLQISSLSPNRREAGLSAPAVGLVGSDVLVNSISSPRSLKSSLRLSKGVSSSDQENLPSPSSTVRNAMRQPLCSLAADYVALYEDDKTRCSAAATYKTSSAEVVLQEQLSDTRKVVFDRDTMRQSAPSGKHSQKNHSSVSSKQQLKHISSGRKGPVRSRNTGAISNIRSDVYLEMANAFERMLTNVETIDAQLDTR